MNPSTVEPSAGVGSLLVRGRTHGAQVRCIEVPAGSRLQVAADPGPQLLLVQRGRGAATPDSAFQHPEARRSLLLLTCAGVGAKRATSPLRTAPKPCSSFSIRKLLRLPLCLPVSTVPGVAAW